MYRKCTHFTGFICEYLRRDTKILFQPLLITRLLCAAN